jgi:hypothetical protein
MMIKFYAECYFTAQITPREVDRETENCVFIEGRKLNKCTQYDGFFNFWEEAQAWLVEGKQKKVARAESVYKSCLKELEDAKELKPCQK